MLAKPQLLAVATVALLGIAGCARASSTDENITHPTTPTTTTAMTEPRAHVIPNGWPQTSAAFPTGWADEAERRAHELEFALGEPSPVTPPNAIGGGPKDFQKGGRQR
jgi:hypothetical protein